MLQLKGENVMSYNRIEVPEAKEAMNRLKTEVANELGVNLKSANLTSKEAGSVGGQMTKRMIEQAEKNLK